MQVDDFGAAAQIAFELQHPGRLLAVVRAARERGREQGVRTLGTLVADFSEAQLKTALEYARDWNTNSRNCHEAHALLQAILLQYSAQACPCALLLA